jgi:uncharacterized protein YciI
VATLGPVHFPAHKQRYEEFAARGVLLMIGVFTNALEDGAMAIFTSREAAEEFAGGDPFVLGGAVASWRILEWREALAG